MFSSVNVTYRSKQTGFFWNANRTLNLFKGCFAELSRILNDRFSQGKILAFVKFSRMIFASLCIQPSQSNWAAEYTIPNFIFFRNTDGY